jgi:hypothetical protein
MAQLPLHNREGGGGLQDLTSASSKVIESSEHITEWITELFSRLTYFDTKLFEKEKHRRTEPTAPWSFPII